MADVEERETEAQLAIINPLTEFEKALDNVISGFVSIDQCRVADSSEARHSSERAFTILVEAARKLDVWFIQRRFLLCQQSPQHHVKEQIEDMRAELVRKENLVQEVQQHIHDWNLKLHRNLSQI